MLEMLPEIIFLLIFGLAIGIFISTAAGTAATLLIPALTIVLGYSTYNSIGTTLAIDCIIGATAGIIFLKNKSIDIKFSVLLIIFGVSGSLIGSQFTSSASESGLKILIGGFLFFLGFNFVRKGVKKNVDYLNSKINFQYFRDHKIFSFILLGSIIGVISGFIGLGSSRMLAVVLVFVMGYQLRQAIGTSLVMMFFIAGVGAVSHSINGEIIPHVLVLAGTTAAIGAAIGSKYANLINEEKLARVAGIVILSIGLFMIITNLI